MEPPAEPTPQTYAALLPEPLRARAASVPEATWWHWRGHQVHVARARRPDASARNLIVHGAGGHSGALWPIAALLAERGLDVAAVDLPLYGRTESPDPSSVRYGDWVRLLVEFIDQEQDGRPLLLVGASLGGMLACEVASRSPAVSAVAATCVLDPADPRVQMRLTRFGPFGLLGRPLAALARGRLARVMIPIGSVANLRRMSRDPRLSRLCSVDPRGGGARVPIGFLASYLRYRHVRPEQLRVPLTMIHPARDEWTPARLSLRYVRRMPGAVDVVMLHECGHFPIEEPGLSDLLDTVADLADGLPEPHAPTE